MILQDLRDLLQKHGRMTRKDLARQLNSSEDGVDAMLQVWMRKGRVSKDEQKVCGGSCCGAAQEVYYRWLDAQGIAIVVRH